MQAAMSPFVDELLFEEEHPELSNLLQRCEKLYHELHRPEWAAEYTKKPGLRSYHQEKLADAEQEFFMLILRDYRYVRRDAPRSGARTKHDPSLYVELAEAGLNNQEIGDRLGVSEATVRRGLRRAGYVRRA
jgi:hypothetical protein